MSSFQSHCILIMGHLANVTTHDKFMRYQAQMILQAQCRLTRNVLKRKFEQCEQNASHSTAEQDKSLKQCPESLHFIYFLALMLSEANHKGQALPGPVQAASTPACSSTSLFQGWK